MPSPLLTIQTAIVALLDGNVGAPVFDYVPATQAPPYVVIGEKTESPFNTMTKAGGDSTVTITVVSDAQGDSEGLTVAGAIRTLLDDAALSLTGHELYGCEHELTTTIRNPRDPGKRQVVMRYRVWTRET